jgi:hypothetical protein
MGLPGGGAEHLVVDLGQDNRERRMDCLAVVMGEAVNNSVCDVPNTREDSDNCLTGLRRRSHRSPDEAVTEVHHEEQVHVG